MGPDTGDIAQELTRDELLVGSGGFWRVSAVGGDRGTAWREPGYSPWDQPGWNGYAGPWGYGESYLRDVISYGTNASSKPPTVYAIETFHIEDPSELRGLRLETLYDDGIVVYLNGAEVARRSMPAGPVTYGTLALGHEATNGSPETIDLTAHLGLIVEGDNDLQVEVHQVSQSSSDLVFSGALIAQIQDPPPPPAEGFIARRSDWSYWDAGGDLGTAWRLPGHDVSQWRRGGGPLGYGESYLRTTVSYGGSASAKHITTYFRRDLHVAEPSAIAHLVGRIMYDDGVVIYLNGTEIQRNAMPAGTVDHTTRSLGHEATAGTYTPYDWDAHRHLLIAGINTLAVEVHQASPSSSDLVFDLELLLYLASATDPPPTGGTSVAPGSTWSYWDQGGDLGTGWRAAAYADGGWATGAGPLGYGESYLATTVSYGPSPATKHPTTYFRKHFDVDLAGGAAVTELAAEIDYDDGVVIYLNGQEVKRLAMPAGTITATTRSTGHEATGYETVDLAAFTGLIVDGDNVIAVEVHQLDGGSSDLVFDLALEVETSGGGGGTVTTPVFTPYAGNPIVVPSNDPEGPTRWRADTVGAPEVLRVGGQWQMFYFANDGLGAHHAVGRALSVDGLEWKLDEDLVAGYELESVVHDGTGYFMYSSDAYEDGISIQTSDDGVNWTGRHPLASEAGEIATVTFDGTWFEMWSEAVGEVAYSTSLDGLDWTTHGIISGLLADEGFHVLKDAAGYHAWDVWPEGIYYLTSADGLAWQRHGLSLAAPSPGAWDERGYGDPTVVRDGATWRMYYTGVGDDRNGRIGTASAPAP